MPIVRNYSRYNAQTVLYPTEDSFFTQQIKPGIQVIPYGNSVLEVLVEDRGAKTTLVLFHAAVNPKQTTLPVFIGHQLTSDIKANLIFVSEPSLDLGASIGWFCGDPTRDLQSKLKSILKHIQESLKTSHNLVFYGSSAGGFASLYYSHHFKHSLAVVANPQTDISKYHIEHVDQFLNRAWGTSNIEDVTATTEVCSMYSKSFPNYVAYLQNCNDDLHISEHCLPWEAATEKFSDRRRFITDNWGQGHAPPNFFLLKGILEYAVSLDGNWPGFLEDESFQTNSGF
ncbi:hypothetical protein [Corynebacterium casei]|uniref:hypothetical protein n=1 Tax=Corynebacterium casei TaxID=160386 RepID=UPI003F945A37